MRHDRIHRADVAAQLARALAISAEATGVAVTVEEHRSRPWASATFTGARHDLILAADRAPPLGAWVAGLADAELALRGHIVASLAVERIDDDGAVVRLGLSALTIEDG